MVLLLTCVSSSMDAISFLRLGHVFIANMTGNVVLPGIALVIVFVRTVSHSLCQRHI